MIACSITDARNFHRWHRSEVLGQGYSNSRARRRCEFDRWSARINGLARNQSGGGGRRNRHDAVFGLHGAAAEVQRRTVNRTDPQEVETQAGADNIGNRIHRAHFMKMHFFDGHLMNCCFSLSQRERCDRARFAKPPAPPRSGTPPRTALACIRSSDS